MGFTAGGNSEDDEPKPEDDGTGMMDTGAALADAAPAGTTPGMETRAGSKRGVFWILAGLVVTGVVAGYDWWRKLPK